MNIQNHDLKDVKSPQKQNKGHNVYNDRYVSIMQEFIRITGWQERPWIN